MASSPFLDALHSGRGLLMDGAMGTELQRAGIGPQERHELWHLTHAREVQSIHQAYTGAGAQVLLTPAEAFAQDVPLRTLKPEEAATLAAMGETLVPGARAAGVVNFVDQQLSIPAEEALLEARIVNVKPPYANF